MSSGPAPRRTASDRVRRESITVSYEAKQYLSELPVDPSLLAGARNALQVALGLRPGQRLVLIAEVVHRAIAAALLHEAEQDGLSIDAYIVGELQASNEAFVNRLCDKLEDADASILVCDLSGLSPQFRRRVIYAGGDRRRHAHMVGITESMMRQSLRADYEEVHQLGERLAACMKKNSVLDVSCSPGTELRIECEPACRWFNGSGLLRKAGWVNLPGGELVTSPKTLSGTVVPDGGVWLPDGTELGRGGRLRLRFDFGELVDAEGLDSDRLLEALDGVAFGRRVGQAAFGTNTSVLTPIGCVLQDLKMPGFHLVLGDSCPDQTGAHWNGGIDVQVLMRRPDVRVDGRPVMVRGRYARDILA